MKRTLKTVKHLTLALTISLSSIVPSMAQEEKSPVQELVGKLKDRLTVHAYGQAGYTYEDKGGETLSTFDLKRVVAFVNAQVTPKWSFLFMHNFGNNTVQEFWVDYSPKTWIGFRVGQQKTSLTIENPLAPTDLELVSLNAQSVAALTGIFSDPLYGNNAGRDIGLVIHGRLLEGSLSYEIGVMNGQGINKKDGNSDKDIVAKVDFCATSWLDMSVSGQKGRGHAVGTAGYNPGINVGDDYRRDRLSAGMRLHYDLVSLRSEALWGWDGDVKSRGIYATALIPVLVDKEKGGQMLDVIGSIDYFDRNTDMTVAQTNVVAGLQYWFYKFCRVQAQWVRCCPKGGEHYNSIQCQAQIAF
ncbi:MAG: porin [Bacteroidales bacterium]|nr:porin [Bacteroidales bacterium]